MYLSIGNIKKSVRRRPSQRATVLIGYLPVSKLQCFHSQERSNQGHRLFHFAMRQLLQPLVTAGLNGVMMTCADGQIRRVYPILASYIADYPEQCLVTCCRENRCPRCKVPPGNRGQRLASLLNDLDQRTESILRDPEKSLGIIRDRVAQAEQYEAQGLRDVPQPFWDGLPYVNIYRCMTPDMLHQLHKGSFNLLLVLNASAFPNGFDSTQVYSRTTSSNGVHPNGKTKLTLALCGFRHSTGSGTLPKECPRYLNGRGMNTERWKRFSSV